jgi:hypothetical protein
MKGRAHKFGGQQKPTVDESSNKRLKLAQALSAIQENLDDAINSD